MKKLFKEKFLKKNIIAVVALIEVLLISIISVFAWTETISSLQIKTQKDGKIDSAISNLAKIDETNTALNLDSYFKESGNVHLASCSSPNGKDFYFPIKTTSSGSSLHYRKGNINDKNVNYISFSLMVNADSADRTFYFRQSPTIKIGDTEISDNSVRTAFYLNDESKGIFAKNNADAQPINNTNGGTASVSVKSFADYSIGKTPLFSVSAGQTATLTISLWLEDPACRISSGVVSIAGLELITNAQQTTRITFADKTSAFNDQNDAATNSWHWVKNDGAVMWMYDGSASYKMTKNGESDEWIANVRSSSYTTNTNIIFYRTASTVTNPVADAADKTKVFNKWTTKYQTDKSTYTAFGSKYNTNGDCRGTWDSVTEITLNAENTTAAKAVLPIPSTTAINKAAHIELLYKDGSSNISVEMSYNSGLWRCFIPTSVKQLGFNAKKETGADTSTLAQNSAALSRNNETAYTVTSQNTGYWGAGVLVKAAVDTSCKDYGSVSVKVDNNEVNGFRVTKGTSVTIAATPKTGYQFKQWKFGSNTSTSQTLTVTANSDLNYVAYFIENYKLTLHARLVGADRDSTTGGTVKLTSGGTSGSTAVYKASGGTQVTLTSVFTATPNANYEIAGWYNSNGSAVSTVTLNGDTDVYVRFKLKSYTITAHATTGGTVQLKSGGTAGSTASYKIESGNSITIENVFTAKANNNYTFDGWYTAETGGSKISQAMTITSNTDVYARFSDEMRTIKFTNNKFWNKVYIYAWNSSERNKDFPGIEITEKEKGMWNSQYNQNEYVYTIKIPYKYTSIIFNDGSSNSQTEDISLSDKGESVNYYITGYDNNKNKYTVGTW